MTFHTALLNKMLVILDVSLDNNWNHLINGQKYLKFSKRHNFLAPVLCSGPMKLLLHSLSEQWRISTLVCFLMKCVFGSLSLNASY